MSLPGGVWTRGTRHGDFAFSSLTGRTELSILEAHTEATGVPAQVTAILSAALGRVGGRDATPEVVRELSVGDRQFLARRLAAVTGRDHLWLNARCDRCDEPFDLEVRQSRLPVKPAGDGYPFVTVQTSLGRVRLRVPNGADQEALATAEETRDHHALLLERLLVEPDDVDVAAFTTDDTAAIDAALETIAPEVATDLLAACPDCAHENRLFVDPYLSLVDVDSDLYSEVHTLASTYGWSEDEILRMPTRRRRIYLERIDRERGVST